MAALSLLAGGACVASTPSQAPAEPVAAGSAVPAGELTVFAAASLSESFTEISRRFTAAHPGTRVRFSFGSSSTLATQIAQGAPADVFAAASEETMRVATDAGTVTEPRPFASNTLQIAVPRGNPGNVVRLADLADPGKTIAICAPQVPCGAASATVFAAAKITPAPDTLEQDVKATLRKVELNEVDAGLVYRTDVKAAGTTVQGIDFLESKAAVNTYPIGVVSQTAHQPTARAFVELVRSEQGLSILKAAGFGNP